MDVNAFNNFVSVLLQKRKDEKKICYLTGDFNLNLLNVDHHGPRNEFFETMYMHSYLPLISKPTRITKTSATLIDNIFYKSDKEHKRGILMTDITDHMPIFYMYSSTGINKLPDTVRP
jgi:hypothetical protein